MKKFGLPILFLATFIISVAAQIALAGESTGEKVQSKAREAKRGVKKGVNRMQEAACAEGDLKCAALKVKHRAGEAKDATVDKTKELKDKVDKD